MKRIGIVMKASEEQARLLGEKITSFVRNSGHEVILETDCADLAEKWKVKASDSISDDADFLVVLGGDGTILYAASMLKQKSIPVLGVNLGRVGYMAEIHPHEAIDELKSVLNGSQVVVKRMMLNVTLPDGTSQLALNEAVIHWGGVARLIDLGVKVGDAKQIEIRADGLIVATPIGSSAYSYAANGPLVHPEIEAIILTPICPFAGLVRPLVIPAEMDIEIVVDRGEDITLTMDGRKSVHLEIGQSLRISRAELPFVMVASRSRDYFQVLKEKLGFLQGGSCNSV